jgi:hypothetical protein
MSRLAKVYIDKTFKVPRPISSVERDLANGYLLLSIARDCEFLSDDDFETAKDDNNPTVIIKNFKLLTEALNQIGIELSKTDIAQIISEVIQYIYSSYCYSMHHSNQELLQL